jgi:hypothetical protein
VSDGKLVGDDPAATLLYDEKTSFTPEAVRRITAHLKANDLLQGASGFLVLSPSQIGNWELICALRRKSPRVVLIAQR